MESRIKVVDTINNMGNAFKVHNPYTIRHMNAIDFYSLEPSSNDEDWLKKYGNKKYTYDVIVRYPEVKTPLKSGHTYSSWNAVDKAIKKKVWEVYK